MRPKNMLSLPLFTLLVLTGFWIGASPSAIGAEDPELTLRIGDQTQVFKRSELLQRKDLKHLDLANNPAYPGQKMSFSAVPVAALFEKLKIPNDVVIQFKCLDGFSAPISKERLLNTNPAGSIAYIAIEEADKPWPALKAGKPSAGPFYLVWPDTALSHISAEEWPYQLAGFEVKGTLESLYPQIFPDAKLPASSPAKLGFAVFTKNCFACHTLNKAGASQMGPDLNVPMNPTEYFQKPALRKLIRNPQSLRFFPRSLMSSFPKEMLSDKDLEKLIAYLEHMAKRKQLN